MTKHLTKPIRAIHSLVLAFLMTLSSPVLAQNFDQGYAAYKAGDYGAALKEWQPLAEVGNAEAQYAIGRLYHSGKGVTRDYNKAVKWYALAAEKGNTDAQVSLGVLYKVGLGVPYDPKEAIKWLKLATEQGNAIAQHSLAGMYRTGRGVIKDNIMAHMWYSIAASNGENASGRRRDDLAKNMPPADISKAQAMARVCVNSGYTKCGY
jgi:uncharacterized protein